MSSPQVLPRDFHPAWPCDGCGRPPFKPTASHKKLRRFGVPVRPLHLKLVPVYAAAGEPAWLCGKCRKTNRRPA
jgi:hypothetical protein